MNNRSVWFPQDMNAPVYVQHGGGLVFTNDNLAPLVGVKLTSNGAPAAIGGTGVGTAIRADGRTVALLNEVTIDTAAGTVSVSVPRECMAIPGPLAIMLQLLDGLGAAVTVLKAVFVVELSETPVIVDPESEITLSIADLVNQMESAEAAIEAALAQIPTDYTALLANFAPTYSASETYLVGNYVIYGGKLYRCTTSITSPQAWNASRWTQISVSTELLGDKDRLENYAAGLTYFNSTRRFSSSNKITPSDLPINSYAYISGAAMATTDAVGVAGFPENVVVSGVYYWVICLASKGTTATRHYFVFKVNESVSCRGRTTNSGTTVTWFTTGTKDLETAVFRGKDMTENVGAAFTYFDVATNYGPTTIDGTTVDRPRAKPTDFPINSYALTSGARIQGFPDVIDDASQYWIFCFASLHNSALRYYLVMGRDDNLIWRGWSTTLTGAATWYNGQPVPDATLSVSGDAADAAATGTAIYWDKTRAVNPPAAFTYFDVANSGLASVTPADMPANSYMLSGGSRLAVPGFPESRGTGTYDQYWIFCVASRSSSGAGPLLRHYFMFGRFTNYFYAGWSSNGGTTVTWFNAHLTADATLSNSGEAADAAAVGEAVYLAKDRVLNAPAGLTYFDISEAYSSDARATPADIPPNSYTQVSGSRLSGFPAGVVDSRTYWVFCLASRHVAAMSQRQYYVYDQSSGFFVRGRSSNSGSAVTWVDTSNALELKVLCIGNSFTQDSVSYAPFLIQEMCPNVRLTMGISYISGGSFGDYISAFNNSGTVGTYAKFTPWASAWNVSSENTTPFKSILTDEKWDVITFNQASSEMKEDYEGDLATLIDLLTPYINAQNGHGVRYAYLIPQAPTNATTKVNYEKMITWIQGQMAANYLDLFIPCGTAIENARNNDTLKDIGRDGLLTWDRLHTIPPENTAYYPGHLQEGLPVLLSSYVSALKILEWCGAKQYGVMGDPLRPTAEWLSGKNMPGPNGTSTGVTDANCYLAQKCAMAAMIKPFETTIIN